MGVKRTDRLESPRLSLGAFRLRPDHGLPVRIENQVTAGADFEPVPSGLVAIEEKRLANRVLVRTGFDRHISIAQNIGRSQHILATVHHIGEMVQPSRGTAAVASDGDVV